MVGTFVGNFKLLLDFFLLSVKEQKCNLYFISLGIVQMTKMGKEDIKEDICDREAPPSFTYRLVLVGLLVSSGIFFAIVFMIIKRLFF